MSISKTEILGILIFLILSLVYYSDTDKVNYVYAFLFFSIVIEVVVRNVLIWIKSKNEDVLE